MFKGFLDAETFSPIPNSFFHHLLKEIDDVDELKVTLYALWRIGMTEGRVRIMREQDFAGVVLDPPWALEKAVRRGSLVMVQTGSGRYYFLNSPRGQAAAESLRTGNLSPAALTSAAPLPDSPNIFRIYEENIGPLTPLLADALRDAEQTYPPDWILEATTIAVANNKRNWKYVEAILKRWKEEGHAKKNDWRGAEKDDRRYSEGEFTEYIKRD